MLAGIRDILVITTPHDAESFERLLGDGSQFGCRSPMPGSPRRTAWPRHSPSVLEFIGVDKVALVPGDNLLYGTGLGTQTRPCRRRRRRDLRLLSPSCYAYGVIDFDDTGLAVSLEEKPATPKSTTQFPVFTSMTTTWSRSRADFGPALAANTRSPTSTAPTSTGGALQVQVPPRGTAWLDTGRSTR